MKLASALVCAALTVFARAASEDADAEGSEPSAAPLVADGAAHQGYRMPGLFGFNGGRPFFLDRDPVTGSVDFNTRTTEVKYHRGDETEYIYEDEDDRENGGEGNEDDFVDGIDRRDGPIRGRPNVAEVNSLHSQTPLVNGIRVHQGYSNHKYTEEDLKFPLISSSYANTKVQGAGGGHLIVRPQPTSSTQPPSYYTIPPRRPTASVSAYSPSTTAATTTTTTSTKKPTTSTTTTTTTTTTTELPYNENYEYDYDDLGPEEPGLSVPPLDNSPSYDISHGYIYPTTRPQGEDSSGPSGADSDTGLDDQDSKVHYSAVGSSSPAPTTAKITTTSTTTPTTKATTTTLSSSPSTTSPSSDIAFVTTSRASETSTATPFIVTSMPLGTHFQHPAAGHSDSDFHQHASTERPSSVNVVLTPEHHKPSPLSHTVPNAVSPDRASPYGAYAEGPFRPIFGPGEGIDDTRSPSGSTVGSHIRQGTPQESPTRFEYLPQNSSNATRINFSPTNNPPILSRFPPNNDTRSTEPPRQSIFLKPLGGFVPETLLTRPTPPTPAPSPPSLPSRYPTPSDNRWVTPSAKPGLVRFPEGGNRDGGKPKVPTEVPGSFVSSVQKVPLPVPPTLSSANPLRPTAPSSVPPIREPSTELQPPAPDSTYVWGDLHSRPPARFPQPPLPSPLPSQPNARPKLDTVPPTFVNIPPSGVRERPSVPISGLPNILPQFRPNAKEGTAGSPDNRFPLYRQHQHLSPPQRLRPPPPPQNMHLRRSDRPGDDAPVPSPPPAPLVHRRAGPEHRRVATLQMIQGSGGSAQLGPFLPPPVAVNREHYAPLTDSRPPQPRYPTSSNSIAVASSEARPVFVVYPVKSGSSSPSDGGVVVGSRGPHRPLPPADLKREAAVAATSITAGEINEGESEDLTLHLTHNNEQRPLLKPSKDRSDTPLLKPQVSKPSKGDFPYKLERPDDEEHLRVSGEQYPKATDDSDQRKADDSDDDDDTEINVVVPYLQDYIPFGTRKPTPLLKDPKDPHHAELHENQWTSVHDDAAPRIVLPHSRPAVEQVDRNEEEAGEKDEEGKEEQNSSESPHITASSSQLYPSRQETQVSVGSGGSELTVSAVMHTRPQVGNHRENHRPVTPDPASPAPLNFQAPFHASANVGAAPTNQGWSVVASAATERGDMEERADVAAPVTASSSEDVNSNFDFENFKPQLFGGFKPIYSFPSTNDTSVASAPHSRESTEREERQL